MTDRLRVTEAEGLLAFLNKQLTGWRRNKIKQRLQGGCVVVNGEPILKHNYALCVGDDVEVRATAADVRKKSLKLEILYSDPDLIAINKPAGLLSVASASENIQHALGILRKQQSNPKNPIKLWPVHRLDRDTSGVLLFATSREMREAVNAKWSEAEKIYWAVVTGRPQPEQATINQPLRLDDKKYHVHVGAHPAAKPAVTHYSSLRSFHDRTLLEVKIDTGHQHQIRAHLAWLGHPVIGDMRYGKEGPRMGLHALRLTITHPTTNKRLLFETPAPGDFHVLLKDNSKQ